MAARKSAGMRNVATGCLPVAGRPRLLGNTFIDFLIKF
jgi:hypothetical protein